MGGLFSSSTPTPTIKREYKPYDNYTNNYNPPTVPTESRSSYTREQYSYNYNDYLDIYNTQPKIEELEVPKVNLYKSINHYCPEWDVMSASGEKMYVNLSEYGREFESIKQHFLLTTRKHLVNVESIQRVQNSHLMGQYMLKKLKMKFIYGRNPVEKHLFHGTKSYNVDSICENNFDWRKRGSQIGHIFGQGVSFSPVSHYASHYCDKGYDRNVIIVAKVLTSVMCVGNKEMIIPPCMANSHNIRYDSSGKEDGKVIVKFDDDEFYPAYKIIFTIKNTVEYFKKPTK